MAAAARPAMKHEEGEPWVQIVEQPKSKAHRFRYACEGRSAGSIPGENSTLEKKTYPSIRINGYSGEAVVVISCLTKETPPRPHPHSIVGNNCNKGVFTQKFLVTGEPINFANLGIRCVKKKDIADALKQRELIRVDPFRTGFGHSNQNIDLNVVRLCFQVFLPGNQGKFNRIISPVLSQPIYDKKSAADLTISRMSRNSGSAKGGDEIFLLCDKVSKDDIKVKFVLFNDRDDTVIWEEYGKFGVPDVHHQYAIVFKTPPFREPLRHPIEVQVILVRPSDGEESEGRSFRYVPDDDDPEAINEKRSRKRFLHSVTDLPSSVADHSFGQNDVMDKLRQSLDDRQKRRRVEPVAKPAADESSDEESRVVDKPLFIDPSAQLQEITSSGSGILLQLDNATYEKNYTSFNSEELSAVAKFMMGTTGFPSADEGESKKPLG